jgi:hypothetical protein
MLPSKQSPPTDRTVEYSWQLCLRQLSPPSSESRVMATLSSLPSAPLQSVSAPEASVKSALPSSPAHEIGTSSYIILGNEDSEPIEAWPEERENRSAWRRRSPASPHRRWERTGNQAATCISSILLLLIFPFVAPPLGSTTGHWNPSPSQAEHPNFSAELVCISSLNTMIIHVTFQSMTQGS